MTRASKVQLETGNSEDVYLTEEKGQGQKGQG